MYVYFYFNLYTFVLHYFISFHELFEKNVFFQITRCLDNFFTDHNWIYRSSTIFTLSKINTRCPT